MNYLIGIESPFSAPLPQTTLQHVQQNKAMGVTGPFQWKTWFTFIDTLV